MRRFFDALRLLRMTRYSFIIFVTFSPRYQIVHLMKVIDMNKTIFALGFFDGVHLGHAALLAACRRLADEKGCDAGVVTFTSHPDTLVSGKTPMLINTSEDRKKILTEQFHIDQVVEIPFNKAVMNTHWASFLETLVLQSAAGFVCGSDFRFGAGGLGTAENLATFCGEQGLVCAIIPQQELHGIRVSSTYIRQLLETGQMDAAVEFLGHPHILSGTVITGRKLGRTLGIPTANIPLPEGVVCPKHGVYACKAYVDGQEYLAVTNIGTRPTVGGHHITVEPWLLDFEGDLYGKKLTLAFYDFLRPEMSFPSLEALKEEILKNAAKTRTFFEKN